MKKHRLLCGILSICLVLMCGVTPAFALTFQDVEGDPTVSWAADAIQQMTDAGYIKGYEDGTYKPYRAISKLECLLLMGRILGAEEDAYAKVAEAAMEQYGATAKRYNSTYVTELSYLLYLGILDESDLASYASAANANTELFRHQAAILMSKMMGRNTEAKTYLAEEETYADSGLIPASSKPYVEFVTAKGIMNGMDANEAGEPQFSPTTSLTRAQMAMLLSRMITNANKTIYTATIQSLDLSDDTIIMKRNGQASSRAICDDTVARQDGMEIKLTSLQEGSTVTVVELDGHIQVITVTEEGDGEVDSPVVQEGTVVYAKIASKSESSSGKRVILADTEDSNNTATYLTTENCVYLDNGSKASFKDLAKNDFVKAVIEDGKVVSLEIMEKTITIEGTLNEVEFDEDNHVYLTVTDEDDNQQKYVVSNKGAKVKRDNETAEFRDLASGDKVRMVLSLGKVTSVEATSSLEKFSGVLSEIVLATKPYLTILVDGEPVKYTLRSNATIKILGVESTIYDLRPNITVTGTLDGNEIRTLSASNVVTNEKGEFIGEVSNINSTYKVITVTDQSGSDQSVYYNSKTTFLKSSGTQATVRDIEKGATLSVTGVETNGIFEATIIIIK